MGFRSVSKGLHLQGSNSPAQTQIGHQISTESTPYPFTALAPPSFPSRTGTSILLDFRSEGLLAVCESGRRRASRDIRSGYRSQLITFGILPDEVLLEIFDFFVGEDGHEHLGPSGIRAREWIKLVHVCRRWRSVVFQSPLRLNLRLLCTPETPARTTLDIWPPLPLIIRDYDDIDDKIASFDNIIAALEHNDRVHQIDLGYLTGDVTDSAAMLKPFPQLTGLRLAMYRYDVLDRILPDSFLGGTAPRLRSLIFEYITFPALPKLLLSTTHLVHLSLFDIPRSGYISPETMSTSLSALTNLESLSLRFQYPRPRPVLESRSLPPHLTRSILPFLTKVHFKGASEYLEVILARIDAPRLDSLHITFFNQLIFDTPQLFQFIDRRPTLRTPEKGHIMFHSKAIIVKFPSQISDYDLLRVKIACTRSEWQLSSLEQICTSSLLPVSTLEDLYIFESRLFTLCWQDYVESMQWLNLLRSFIAVKNLYVSKEFVPRIAPALQELVRGRTTEVLPALNILFLEGFQPSAPLHEGIQKFIAARRLTGHPVEVLPLDKEGYREIFNL